MANIFEQLDPSATSSAPAPAMPASGNIFDQLDPTAEQQAAQSPGITDRLLNDASKRQKTVKDLEQNSPMLAGSKAVGQAAGFLAQDVPGEVAKSAYDALPEHVQEGIKNAGQWAVNTDLGKHAIEAMKAGGDVWNSFKKVHPDMASLVEDAANAGTFLAAAPVAGPVADTVGTAAGKAISTPAKAAIEGADTIKEGFLARTPEILDQATAGMKSVSTANFTKMRKAGAELTGLSSDQIVTDAVGALNQSGRPHSLLHGDTMQIVKELENEQAKGPLQLEQLDQYSRVLNGIVRKNTDIKGMMNEDALKALDVMDSINEGIGNLTAKDIASGDPKAVQALQDAKGQWAKARKFEQVSNVLRQADGDANKIKAGFKRLVDSPKAMRGFTDDEKDLLRQAAKNTFTEGLLKSFGKFGFDLGSGGNMGNTVIPAAEAMAAMAGVPHALPAVIGGTAARQTQKYLARGKAEKVLQQIEKR